MKSKYHKLWILLREKLTQKENQESEFSTDRTAMHAVLTMMAELESAEFLED